MSALAGLQSLDASQELAAVIATATDGRTATVTKAEIQSWFRTNNRATLDQGSAWVGQTLTDRWNALGGVVPLKFLFHVFALNPLDYQAMSCALDYNPPSTWWQRG